MHPAGVTQQSAVIVDDFNLNPHFLNTGGLVTRIADTFKLDKTDCTGATIQGNDTYFNHKGIFLSAPRLPSGRFHRFRVNDITAA